MNGRNFVLTIIAALVLYVGVVEARVGAKGPAPAGLPGKVGYVNFDALIKLEDGASQEFEALEKQANAVAEREQKAQIELQNEMAALSKMTEKAQAEKRTAFSNKVQKLQQEFTKERMELEHKKREILARLEQRNQLLLEKIVSDEGYDAVLNAGAFAFINPKSSNYVDLTPEVAKRYNNAYPLKKPATSSSASSSSTSKK